MYAQPRCHFVSPRRRRCDARSTPVRRVVAGRAGQRRQRGDDELCGFLLVLFGKGWGRVAVPFWIGFAAWLGAHGKIWPKNSRCINVN
jgi:hypothetical protein